jgi:hypothetical protein
MGARVIDSDGIAVLREGNASAEILESDRLRGLIAYGMTPEIARTPVPRVAVAQAALAGFDATLPTEIEARAWLLTLIGERSAQVIQSVCRSMDAASKLPRARALEQETALFCELARQKVSAT